MLKSNKSESAAVGNRCHTYASGGLGEIRKDVRRRTELEKVYKRKKDFSSVGGESIHDPTDQETEAEGCREMA